MNTALITALQNYYPYNQITDRGMEELCPNIEIHDHKITEDVTQYLDNFGEIHYLAEGQIEIECTDSGTKEQFNSIIDEQLTPLPDQIPETNRVTALTDIKILSINQQALNKILAKDQPHNPQVKNFLLTGKQGKLNWKEAFLMASGFRHIASEVTDEAFRRMEPVKVSKGEVIIKQGEVSEYFYIIVKGRCEVIRESETLKQPLKLVEYGPGASIGEDALVSDQPRNATVVMLTDGKLMRMNGNDFRFLFALPLTRSVDFKQAREFISNGGRWLDVRMPNEVKDNMRLPDSLCIPHPILRNRLLSTDPKYRYIVACNDGQDSSVMTYVLSKYGFDAFYLQEGLNSIPGYEFSMLKQ